MNITDLKIYFANHDQIWYKVIVKIFSLESDSNLIYYHTFDEQIFAQFASMNYSKP
jgi:hypothetical protein